MKMQSLAFSVVAVTVLLFVHPARLIAQNHVITPHDIVTLKKVEEPQLSPDGTAIVYSVLTPKPATDPKTQSLWMTSSTTGNSHPLSLSDGADSMPRWSPDGKQIAFLSTRKNPIRLAGESPFPFSLAGVESRPDLVEAQKDAKLAKEFKQGAELWLLPVGGGEAIPLTNIPGDIKAFRWSPDGKQIAFIRTDVDTKDEKERKEKKIDDHRVDFDYRFDRLYIFELATHVATLVTPGDRNLCDFDWSPDGKHFITRISPTPRLDDYWRVSKVQILSATTGNVEKTLAEHAMSLSVGWSADGHHVTYGKMTERGITGIPVITDLSTSKEALLGANLPITWEKMKWSADGHLLIMTGLENTTGAVADVDIATGRATVRTHRESSVRDFSLSRDGSVMGFAAGSISSPAEVTTLRGTKWQMLTDTNPQVHDWKIGVAKEVHWKSTTDGKTIYGVMVLPANYIAGKRYKTLVQFHGGPEGSWDTGWLGSWHDWAQMMASHGFAVLLPNPRGSDGQGPEFVESNYRDWGGADFQDEMDGTDFIVAQGIADNDKMVAGGWSYGGFMTSWTITHTNRFKAAVIGAGVTDLVSMATTTDIAPSFLGGYFGDLSSNREIYRLHSPVTFLSNCVTPSLIVHGDADERVPTFQGQEFYNGLRYIGRDAEMIRFPREPHVFVERDHQEALLNHVLNWFESHVK